MLLLCTMYVASHVCDSLVLLSRCRWPEWLALASAADKLCRDGGGIITDAAVAKMVSVWLIECIYWNVSLAAGMELAETLSMSVLVEDANNRLVKLALRGTRSDIRLGLIKLIAVAAGRDSCD